jgi:hypothetical protein
MRKHVDRRHKEEGGFELFPDGRRKPQEQIRANREARLKRKREYGFRSRLRKKFMDQYPKDDENATKIFLCNQQGLEH